MDLFLFSTRRSPWRPFTVATPVEGGEDKVRLDLRHGASQKELSLDRTWLRSERVIQKTPIPRIVGRIMSVSYAGNLESGVKSSFFRILGDLGGKATSKSVQVVPLWEDFRGHPYHACGWYFNETIAVKILPNFATDPSDLSLASPLDRTQFKAYRIADHHLLAEATRLSSGPEEVYTMSRTHFVRIYNVHSLDVMSLPFLTVLYTVDLGPISGGYTVWYPQCVFSNDGTLLFVNQIPGTDLDGEDQSPTTRFMLDARSREVRRLIPPTEPLSGTDPVLLPRPDLPPRLDGFYVVTRDYGAEAGSAGQVANSDEEKEREDRPVRVRGGRAGGVDTVNFRQNPVVESDDSDGAGGEGM
ncbi:hypothetical protein HDV00_002652 [Rhizophlyctis rosea]|nr:hypothetical protein HDV00_002652 [Rhizophlyctis rosea]